MTLLDILNTLCAKHNLKALIGRTLFTTAAWWNDVYDMFEQYGGVCVFNLLYTIIYPSVYFDFVSSDGNIVTTQYNTCKPIANDDISYIVYANGPLKYILSYNDADKVYNGNHSEVNALRHIIIKTPFYSAVSLNNVQVFPLMGCWWYTLVSSDYMVDLKTNRYNYFVNGNVLNKCILAYILKRHYPNITLLPGYSLKVLTNTFLNKTYEGDFSIQLKDT
jgi:hypothetical protein